MRLFFQDKIILIFGFFSLGLYALISLLINLTDQRHATVLAMSFLFLYIIYFFAWQYFSKNKISSKRLKLIGIFSLLFAATLIFLVPSAGGDFYHYFFEDAVFASYGLNPYLFSPTNLPYDTVSSLSNWPELPSQHGPFKFFLTLPAFYLGQGLFLPTLFLYKLLYFIFFVGSLALVFAILKELKHLKINLSFLLFAWNPLIIFTPQISGGNDILLLFFFLLAIYMAIKNRFYQATLFLTLSILVKYVTLITLPVFFIYYLSKEKTLVNKIKEFFKHITIIVFFAVFLFIPFWQGPEIFNGLIWTGSYFSANSVPGLLYLISGMGGLNISQDLFKRFFEILYILILSFISLKFLFVKNPSSKKFITYLFLALITFLFIGKFWLFYKYFAWVIPLLFFMDKKYFAFGVFLTGLIVFGEVYLGYLVILLLPPALLFAFYYLFQKILKHKML